MKLRQDPLRPGLNQFLDAGPKTGEVKHLGSIPRSDDTPGTGGLFLRQRRRDCLFGQGNHDAVARLVRVKAIAR